MMIICRYMYMSVYLLSLLYRTHANVYTKGQEKTYMHFYYTCTGKLTTL